jgi:hypothetical protein
LSRPSPFVTHAVNHGGWLWSSKGLRPYGTTAAFSLEAVKRGKRAGRPLRLAALNRLKSCGGRNQTWFASYTNRTYLSREWPSEERHFLWHEDNQQRVVSAQVLVLSFSVQLERD